MHAILAISVAVAVAALIVELTWGLPWIGRVTRVADGDSVETITRGKLRRIRLVGVDAPEYRQDHGKTARKALADMVDRRLVLFVPNGRDVYDRFPCVMITIAGPVSWRMALAGHAWPDSIATGILHLPSRILRRGLWAGPAMRPKDWRRRNPR